MAMSCFKRLLLYSSSGLVLALANDAVYHGRDAVGLCADADRLIHGRNCVLQIGFVVDIERAEGFAFVNLVPNALVHHEADRRIDFVRHGCAPGTEYLRRTALHERDGPTIIVDDDVLKDMLRNLKGAATNVNQVAYVVNSRHRPEELLPELRRSLACIEASSEAITKLITDARNSI